MRLILGLLCFAAISSCASAPSFDKTYNDNPSTGLLVFEEKPGMRGVRIEITPVGDDNQIKASGAKSFYMLDGALITNIVDLQSPNGLDFGGIQKLSRFAMFEIDSGRYAVTGISYNQVYSTSYMNACDSFLSFDVKSGRVNLLQAENFANVSISADAYNYVPHRGQSNGDLEDLKNILAEYPNINVGVDLLNVVLIESDGVRRRCKRG